MLIHKNIADLDRLVRYIFIEKLVGLISMNLQVALNALLRALLFLSEDDFYPM